MKKLSETYKELGIAFSFPIEIKDAKGNETYWEGRGGYWYRREYDANDNVTYFEDWEDYWHRYERDANGNKTYFENSEGLKRGTPKSSKTCAAKMVIRFTPIDGYTPFIAEYLKGAETLETRPARWSK
jgi:hypothetical protein